MYGSFFRETQCQAEVIYEILSFKKGHRTFFARKVDFRGQCMTASPFELQVSVWHALLRQIIVID